MDQTHRHLPTTLAIDSLPPYQERTFVPAAADLTQAATVTGLYQQLLERPLATEAALAALIDDRSELEAAVSQVRSILYIRMTCQTDDPARAGAYQQFIETVVPATQSAGDRLDRAILDAVDKLGVQNPRYAVYFRKIRSDIALFRQVNVPLKTDDALLRQRYQTVTGAMTVTFDGTEYPISQMRKFQMTPDRSVRRAAWEATTARYEADAETLETLFDEMIAIRTQIAHHAGFDNFRDYQFQAYHRFDYTPADCKQYHAAIETHLVPILRQVLAHRADQMGLDRLRPWDLQADPLGREPLTPFDSTPALIEGMGRMFAQLDPGLGADFRVLMDHGLLDLDSRKGKAPGGYQSTLDEARKPFIFMNAVGTNDDLRVLMHEGGHAFHALACAADPLVDYRHAPMEFCEVASMAMEFLAATELSVCYDAAGRARWWRDQLETVLRILVSVAVNDAFQHWLYEHPRHQRQERQAQWIALNERFGSDRVDWSGYEAARGRQWHAILHLFQVPFYYMEYGIAQLGALGLWQQSQKDLPAALGHYKAALALGGSRPLPVLFAAAGLPFDFSAATIQPLAQAVLRHWETVNRQ